VCAVLEWTSRLQVTFQRAVPPVEFFDKYLQGLTRTELLLLLLIFVPQVLLRRLHTASFCCSRSAGSPRACRACSVVGFTAPVVTCSPLPALYRPNSVSVTGVGFSVGVPCKHD
jgi:hypothetical protein